jgi:hypothetical protein
MKKLIAVLVGLLAVVGVARAADPLLPITVQKGGSSTRGAGIALYRQRPDIPAGSKLSFLGRYDPKANQIRFLDPPWLHVTWPRQLHWRIHFSVKTGDNVYKVISQYLEPTEADAIQKLPAIVKYVKQVKKSGNGGRRVPNLRLSLHAVYDGKVPEKFANLDAHKTMVGVYCDNLGDSRPAVQQAFMLKPDKKPAPLHPGMIAVFTGEIHVNRPELNYHQKEEKKLHHFNLKLVETRPVKVNLDEKTAQQACRDLIAKSEQRLRDTCRGEALTFQFDSEKPLRTTWIDEQMVVSGLITPRPDYSREPVPYATASVFFDPETGKPQRITVVRRVHQDPPD